MGEDVFLFCFFWTLFSAQGKKGNDDSLCICICLFFTNEAVLSCLDHASRMDCHPVYDLLVLYDKKGMKWGKRQCLKLLTASRRAPCSTRFDQRLGSANALVPNVRLLIWSLVGSVIIPGGRKGIVK